MQNQQNSVAVNKISKYLCMNSIAQKILTSTKNHLREKLRDENISFNQWQILRLLRTNEGITSSEIATYLGCDAGSVSRQLDGLENRGFITRVRNVDDRRAIDIALTTQGLNVAKKITFSLDAYSEELKANLNDRERNILDYISAYLVEDYSLQQEN